LKLVVKEYTLCSIKDLILFSSTADASPTGPDTDRMAGACLFGETETQRTERHVLMLRRFSDLAMKAAERIDRQADAAGADQP
jgi:hypothetical protein